MGKLENISVSEYAKMLGELYNNPSEKKGILMLFSKIFKLLDINKLKVITYNNSMDKYLTMYEINKEDGLLDYSKKMNIEIKQCINFGEFNDSKQADFRKVLVDGYMYVVKDEVKEKKEFLKEFGLEIFDETNEVCVYLAQSEVLFTYTAFERNSDEQLSQSNFDILISACQMVNNTINNIVREKMLVTDIEMKNMILENEKIPISIVRKDDFKVLSYNELYKDVIPDIKKGHICQDLKYTVENATDEMLQAKELILNIDDNENEQQWIKKGIPFEMSNGTTAYMVYSKNNEDYINQIKAVDLLTDALLLRGFNEYYKNFVQRNNDKYALCTLDIDKFKYINNVFGYNTGDEVLKKVSDEIKNFVDSEENFCRMGEDKFSILVHYNDDVQLHLKFRELSKNFENMRDKYFQDIRITIIGGITLVDKEQPLNVLIDQATMARKSAKGSHKNKFSYYNVELDIKLQKEIHIEEQIPHALANDEFNAYLQPKFDINTKKICGAEALVRWITPKGMIFPDQFIPLFEKNGFILTLDFIIYEKVMKYIRHCLDNNLPVYPISVNVSRNHIKDKLFIEKFMNLVNKYDVPHEYLELEVTESVFVEDKNELKIFIDKIKEQDLKVSIDDFGTAYSSLQTLTDINVDILKIDKGFLDNINLEEEGVVSKDEILIKNIINLAKELDFKVICEGVETDKQIELLKKVGCECGQGYVFAKPMPISDYEELFIKIKN